MAQDANVLKALYATPKAYKLSLVPSSNIRLDAENIQALGVAQGASLHAIEKEARTNPENVKMIAMVRHGEGDHNSAEREFGSEKWEAEEALKEKYLDVSLNSVGIAQCESVQASMTKALKSGFKIDAVLVSPLTRALETAAVVLQHVWSDALVPKIAVEMSRERYGKNQCDKRRSVTELKSRWPMVNFDDFMNGEQDEWWTPERETNEHVKKRASHFFRWVMASKKWKSIVVVGHSSFMSNSYELLSQGDHHWPSNGEVVPMLVKATLEN